MKKIDNIRKIKTTLSVIENIQIKIVLAMLTLMGLGAITVIGYFFGLWLSYLILPIT